MQRGRQQPDELGGLVDAERATGLAEVVPGRGADAVDARRELRDVDVDLQDPPLGHDDLHRLGRRDLQCLAERFERRVATGPQEQVLRGLLGDRRPGRVVGAVQVRLDARPLHPVVDGERPLRELLVLLPHHHDQEVARHVLGVGPLRDGRPEVPQPEHRVRRVDQREQQHQDQGDGLGDQRPAQHPAQPGPGRRRWGPGWPPRSQPAQSFPQRRDLRPDRAARGAADLRPGLRGRRSASRGRAAPADAAAGGQGPLGGVEHLRRLRRLVPAPVGVHAVVGRWDRPWGGRGERRAAAGRDDARCRRRGTPGGRGRRRERRGGTPAGDARGSAPSRAALVRRGGPGAARSRGSRGVRAGRSRRTRRRARCGGRRGRRHGGTPVRRAAARASGRAGVVQPSPPSPGPATRTGDPNPTIPTGRDDPWTVRVSAGGRRPGRRRRAPRPGRRRRSPRPGRPGSG